MDSILELPLTAKSGRVLQITDTHLFADDDGELLGINTNDSFKAVLAAISKKTVRYDLIVATGDIAQDQSRQAYQRFANDIKQFDVPCIWLPGNHDIQSNNMCHAFQPHKIISSKVVLFGEYWVVVLLDSQVSGVPHGHLSDDQLQWLDQVLATHANRYALVLLHHHPVASGCDWLDQHRLNNAEKFDMVLNKHPQVRSLLCGHIHQPLDLFWKNRRVLATPSTCVQFKPGCREFTLDSKGPGWREIELYNDGNIGTTVQYIEETYFLPNMESRGY